ncbi:hypothetical protein [Lichenicoccus sp.]|uniref:hypothetical protein n=1 Tax=Lichenicoccus sp. TaxID=2781899 RepID=UPI003D0B56EA
MGGATGLISTAQGAGRFLANHSGYDPVSLALSNPIAKAVENLPIQKWATDAENAAGWYSPKEASGKILEGAVGGVTGAALSGGVGLVPTLSSAAIGAAVPTAKAAGATDDQADDIGLALGLLPVAGAGAWAARNGAGALARNAYAASISKGMTPEQAAQQVLLHDAVSQYGASNGLKPAQASQAYGDATNAALSAYRSTALKAGAIDPDQASALMAAQRSAAAGTGGSAVKAAGLDGYHQDAVANGVGQIDALANQAPSSGTVGPFASVGSAVGAKAAPVVGGLGALTAAAAGNYHTALDIALGSAAGHSVLPVAGKAAGGVIDWALGAGMTPQQAQLLAARRVLAKSGISLPSSDPLGDLQSAVSDVNGDFTDQQTNVANTAADALRAKQTATGYSQNAKATAAAEAVWAGALSQQAKQQAAGNPDPLSSALWADAQQQGNPPNLKAVTNSQIAGFTADQSALAKRDTQEQAADAAAQQRGQSLNEQAAAWLERDAIRQYKSNTPDAPVTGVGSLTASTPQQLFGATAGKYGSPADPTPPQMLQPPVAPLGAAPRPVAAPPAAPTPAPATPLPAAAPVPSTGLGAGPLTPSGGQALVSMLHQQHFGTPLQTPDITAAIEDLAADGTLHPFHADAALSGQLIDRQLAGHIAARAQLLKTQGQTSLDQGAISSQATADVQQAMGNAPAAAPTAGTPNGGPRGPILNLTRYQGAVGNYQRHAQQMFMLATSPAEKQAVSEIAATPATADKAAIRDAYVRTHPGADLSRFTPTLMRGT